MFSTVSLGANPTRASNLRPPCLSELDYGSRLFARQSAPCFAKTGKLKPHDRFLLATYDGERAFLMAGYPGVRLRLRQRKNGVGFRARNTSLWN